MQVIRDLATLTPDTPMALTVGVFDGIHRGHQHLIQQTAQAAAALGGKAGMITFWPHPLEVLHPERKISYLTMLEEKLAVLARLRALDLVVVLPFTPTLVGTSAAEFIDLLLGHLKLRVLVEGADFVFGHNREGNMAFLTTYGQTHGFAVQTIDLQVADEQRISSTSIRALLADGQVEGAMALLGRPYSARGLVVHGDQRGRLLGFPTANLEIDPQKILPADGVYAVRVRVDDTIYSGATNIGMRPTVDGTKHLTEVHVLDMQRDLYQKELEVQFIARLRGERRFAGIEALQAQIAADVQQARVVLGQYTEREERGVRAVNVLSKFESFMTTLVEGSFGRVFRTKLQPVELKRKLERHMEDHLLIMGEGHRQAHNIYDVALSQKDYDEFGAYRALKDELAQYLIKVARERGYTLATDPVVQLRADPHLIVGNLHIESIDSSKVDSKHPPQNANIAQALAGPDAPMHTVTIDVSEGFKQALLEAQRASPRPPAAPQGANQPYPLPASPSDFQQYAGQAGAMPYAPPAAPPQQMPQAVLRLRRRGGQTGAEQVYRLDREVIQIGRHVSNDIVVNDRRVSRHHAQVRYENGRFVIYDLGSLNGIGINRTTVRQHTLRDGDLVSVGSYDFIFHQRR